MGVYEVIATKLYIYSVTFETLCKEINSRKSVAVYNAVFLIFET